MAHEKIGSASCIQRPTQVIAEIDREIERDRLDVVQPGLKRRAVAPCTSAITAIR